MNRLYLIAALILALCISVGINISQYLNAFEREIAAPLEAKIETFTVTEKINVAVSKARATDGAELERLRTALATKQVQTVIKWRTTVSDLAPPACSPDPSRVAAWNTLALGETP